MRSDPKQRDYDKTRKTLEFKGFPKGTYSKEIADWLKLTLEPLSSEIEASFATRKFNTMGLVVLQSEAAKRALKAALRKKIEGGQELNFSAEDGKLHQISYYDKLTPEESKRQAVQRRIRRAVLKIDGELTTEKVVAERGSGKVWVNRSPIATVSKDGGNINYVEEALKTLNIQAARIVEVMSEEAVNS